MRKSEGGFDSRTCAVCSVGVAELACMMSCPCSSSAAKPRFCWIFGHLVAPLPVAADLLLAMPRSTTGYLSGSNVCRYLVLHRKAASTSREVAQHATGQRQHHEDHRPLLAVWVPAAAVAAEIGTPEHPHNTAAAMPSQAEETST